MRGVKVNLNGQTKVLGVIGDPIEHTMSPYIHNRLIEELSHNHVYVPFHVKKDGLEKAIHGAHALGIQGLNVTIPHKEEVLDHLVEVDILAKQIGAVNTLKKTANGYKGYNTDAYGLLTSLEHNNISLKDKVVLLIGAGGAAKAAAILCASQGVKKLMIMNRTIKKAEDLAYVVKKYYDTQIEIYPLNSVVLDKKIHLCIQTTPIGMHGHSNEAPISESELYQKIEVAVDIIYNPMETLFLKRAREHKALTLNGIEMLFYQGIKAYEIWFDMTIPLTIQNKLLLEIKNKLQRGI